MAIKHKIRARNGKTEIISLTARRAIQKFCKECLGWEVRPIDCNDKLCALWPFRTWQTPKDTIKKGE